jgi:hypothetical protein
MVEYYILVYENGKKESGKVRAVETVPGLEGGEKKENDGGVNSSMIHCKNFCKCLSTPQHN